jgi:hypothetical protein
MRSLGRAPTELEVKEYQKSVDKGDGSFNIDGLMDVMVRSYKSLDEEEEAILSAFRYALKPAHPCKTSCCLPWHMRREWLSSSPQEEQTRRGSGQPSFIP